MSTVNCVTSKDFVSEVVDSSIPVLVDFYADWCAPCRMLSPALEKLASEYSGRVKIVKVNVDADPALAGHFEVQSIPMLLAFSNGAIVDKLVGIGSPGQLKQVLTKLAGSAEQSAVRVG